MSLSQPVAIKMENGVLVLFFFSGGGWLVVKTRAVFSDLFRTKSIEETLIL